MEEEEDYISLCDEKEVFFIETEAKKKRKYFLSCVPNELQLYSEQLQLKRPRFLPKYPHYTSSAIELIITNTSLTKDILIPVLIQRGSLKDLVSFCNTNQSLYRMYKIHCESKALEKMIAYRFIPNNIMSKSYPPKPDTTIETEKKAYVLQDHRLIPALETYKVRTERKVFVLAFCDEACSIKKDTRLHLRVNMTITDSIYINERGWIENRYYYQDSEDAPFKDGFFSDITKTYLLRDK